MGVEESKGNKTEKVINKTAMAISTVKMSRYISLLMCVYVFYTHI
jgi:hypothetical protein